MSMLMECYRNFGMTARNPGPRWAELTNGVAIAVVTRRVFPSPLLERAMKFTHQAVLPPAFALLSACRSVSTNATLIDPTSNLVRTCPAAVKLFTTPDRVQQPYREIALLNSSGQTSYSSEGDMIKSMREKAAKVGANGIILNGIDEPSAMAKLAGVAAQVAADATGQIAQISAERTGHAMAVYIPADSTRTTAACADPKK
jgi:hypothetical protein